MSFAYILCAADLPQPVSFDPQVFPAQTDDQTVIRHNIDIR